MDHVSAILGDKSKYLNPAPMNDNSMNVSDSNFLPPQSTPISSPLPSREITPSSSLQDNEKETSKESINTEFLKAAIYKIKDQIEILLQILEGKELSLPSITPRSEASALLQTGGRVLEGIFNGEKMVSDDGEIFSIPQNYASKSKMIEGDRLKLTINPNGSLVYKQIGPIERKRIRGELISGSSSGQWLVASEGKTYKVLTASVTFHKGRIGDEVVLLVPGTGQSDWGAIEYVIHKD